jgi:hypothetical protein
VHECQASAQGGEGVGRVAAGTVDYLSALRDSL